MSKGILLIALGAPEYGCMAANLAASIRYADKDVPIHLVWSGASISNISDRHKELFTSMSECPKEYYTHNGTTEYIKAKTHIYDLSPFDETLFLDVDMYIFPHVKISDTINELSAVCDWTIENRGYEDLSKPDDKIRADYSTWCSILDVKKHFKTQGRYYHLHSEFIFFKKTEINQLFFDEVRNIYDTRPIKWTVFNEAVPDEYAFDIAACTQGHYPHQDGYVSIYWYAMDGRPDWNKKVVKNYIGFSLAGNTVPLWLQQKVNAYKQLFRQALKLTHLYNVPPKRMWNKQRKTI